MEVHISFLTGSALIYYKNVFYKSKSPLISEAFTPFGQGRGVVEAITLNLEFENRKR